MRFDRVRYGIGVEDAFCAAGLLLAPVPQADQLPNLPCRHLIPDRSAGSNSAGLVIIAFAPQKSLNDHCQGLSDTVLLVSYKKVPLVPCWTSASWDTLSLFMTPLCRNPSGIEYGLLCEAAASGELSQGEYHMQRQKSRKFRQVNQTSWQAQTPQLPRVCLGIGTIVPPKPQFRPNSKLSGACVSVTGMLQLEYGHPWHSQQRFFIGSFSSKLKTTDTVSKLTPNWARC